MRNDHFAGVTTEEMKRRIASARLGRINTKIAQMKFIDGEDNVDIAAAFPKRDRCSRTSVGRRLKDIMKALDSVK